MKLFHTVVSLVLFFYLSEIVDDSEVASSTQLDQGYFAFVVVGLAFMKFMETGLTAFALKLANRPDHGNARSAAGNAGPAVACRTGQRKLRAVAFRCLGDRDACNCGAGVRPRTYR